MGSEDYADVATDDLPWDWEGRHELMRRMSDEFDEPTGIPMPLRHHRLVTEDKYPFGDISEVIRRQWIEQEAKDNPQPYVHVCRLNDVMWYPVNEWTDVKRNRHVSLEQAIYDPATEYPTVSDERRVRTYPLDDYRARLELWLETVSASDAWDLSAEERAMAKLKDLVDDFAYRRYVLTGSFMEMSTRSRVAYVFRRLRPTIAFAPADRTDKHCNRQKVLAVLCMHPTGYYANSWAGALCPTDDVLAHLLTMRADEHYFWRTANQHPGWAATAGI